MNRYLTLLTVVAFPFSSLPAQVFVDTMYFDRDWQQTSADNASYYRVIEARDDGSFHFDVTDYYLSGKVQMTGTYRSIRPDFRTGTFTYWYENGKKQAESEYLKNMLNGPSVEWYENGRLKSKQHYTKDKLNGTYQSWNSDGTPKLEIQYYLGKKHGSFISYYPDGSRVREDLYENDELIEGRCFDEEGNPVEYFPYVQMPAFRGGLSALQEFIRQELDYPKRAYRKGIQGRVFVRFTVDREGNVQDPVIIQAGHQDFNEEALRLVSSFPRWIPGKIDGNPAPLQVTIPVEFIIQMPVKPAFFRGRI